MSQRRLASWAAVVLLTVGGAVALAGSAQAAVPDRFGFALFSGGVVSEATPAATTVVAGPPGRWTVTFPGQGIAGGVVHVTAVHNAIGAPPGRWCQADSWGPLGANEIVKVSCYAPGGGLDATPGFSVLFSRSSGPVGPGRYGYIDGGPGGFINSQYNSVGAANGLANVGVGMYSVSFPGLGTPGPQAGGLQVTAANPVAGARCKVAVWSSSAAGQSARIMCFNAAGALANTRFSVSYQYQRSLYGPAFPPGRFGYLWNMPPLGPAPTSFNSSGGANGLAGGPPVWTATFANIAASPGNTQVTAFGTTSFYCGLHVPWFSAGATLVAQVNCFTNAGAPVNSGFLVSYSSRF